MYQTVNIDGIGEIKGSFRNEGDIPFELQKAISHVDKISMDTAFVISNHDDEGRFLFKMTEGKLGDYLLSTSYLLHVEGVSIGNFDSRGEMDNHLRVLINEWNYSLKTNISIIDENKHGIMVNQFVGEIWHYLNDWDEDMMATPKKAPKYKEEPNKEEKNHKVTIELEITATSKEEAIQYAVNDINELHKNGVLDANVILTKEN